MVKKKPPSVRTKKGKFTKRTFQGKHGWWFYRRDDGKTVRLKKDDKRVIAAQKRAASKERAKQKEAKRKAKLEFLLRLSREELKEYWTEKKAESRISKAIKRRDSTRMIKAHLDNASGVTVTEAEWSVEIWYEAGRRMYERRFSEEMSGLDYATFHDVLDSMRTDDLLAAAMSVERRFYLIVAVRPPDWDNGDDYIHWSLCHAENWEIAIDQSTTKMEEMAQRLEYRSNAIVRFIIRQYK